MINIKTNTAWIDDDVEVSIGAAEEKTKPVSVTIIAEDPLALIVKWREDGTDSLYCRAIDLLRHPQKLSPELTQVDSRHRKLAESIRQYYLGKFVTEMLKGNKLTEYRKKLYHALESRNTVSNNSITALYKCVDFYFEDIEMDRFLKGASSVEEIYFTGGEFADHCTYLGSTTKRSRRIRQKRYWFKNKNNNLLTFYIDSNCASAPIVEQYLVEGKNYYVQSPTTNTVKVPADDFFLAYYLGNKYNIKEVK